MAISFYTKCERTFSQLAAFQKTKARRGHNNTPCPKLIAKLCRCVSEFRKHGVGTRSFLYEFYAKILLIIKRNRLISRLECSNFVHSTRALQAFNKEKLRPIKQTGLVRREKLPRKIRRHERYYAVFLLFNFFRFYTAEIIPSFTVQFINVGRTYVSSACVIPLSCVLYQIFIFHSNIAE